MTECGRELRLSPAGNYVFDGRLRRLSAIPDIEEKILALEEEIRHIMDTDPYQYKFLLIDEEEVAARKDALNEELKKYQEYSRQLDTMLTEMLPEGVIMIWDLN